MPLNTNSSEQDVRDPVTIRKISGSTKPSKVNQEAFDEAVHEIAHITQHLLDELVTTAPPKNRDVEAEKARERARLRYG